MFNPNLFPKFTDYPQYSESVDGSGLIEFLVGDGVVYNTVNHGLYIPDVGAQEYGEPGIMVAFLTDDMLAEIEETEDIIDYALSNIPAPGTCAPNKMVSITVVGAIEEILSNPEEFVIIAMPDEDIWQ